ncbi:MAG: 6-bladed beta-propeller [Nitrospinota bacterium]
MSGVSARNSKALSIWALVCLLGLGLLAGCAAQIREEAAEELVWPLPPEVPRIKYVGELSKPTDVGKEKAASSRLIEAVLGIRSEDSQILLKPYGVHGDQKARVYVADSATGKVVVFDRHARDVFVLGKRGLGQLGKAMGVTTGKDGRIYVADASGRRVVVYDPEGQFLKAMGGKEVLARPVGVAVDDERGRVYVADTWAHQVVAFDQEGKVLFRIGKKAEPREVPTGASDHAWNRSSEKGEFRFPTNIALDRQGRLYVVDSINFRVQVFDPGGTFLFSFGRLGDGFGEFARPKGIALDSDGHIYVVDAAFNNVQIFDPRGRLLLFFGNIGRGRGEFWLPAGIAIDPSDKIYVVDQYNRRVQIFQYLKQTLAKKGGK